MLEQSGSRGGADARRETAPIHHAAGRRGGCVTGGGAGARPIILTKADLVQLVVTLGVYDNRCEKLAPGLLADLQRIVRMLDKDDVTAGVINEHEKVDRAGEAKWCDALRPVVKKYESGLFEPTRPHRD